MAKPIDQSHWRRYWVSGLVQGVWFRASARERALALGLIGSAENLDDGRVEVTVYGLEQALDSLERWLAVGPPGAQVQRVERATQEHSWPKPHSGFEIR